MLLPDQEPLPGANANNNDEGGPIDDEKVMEDVQLAQTRGMSIFSFPNTNVC